MSKKLSKSVRIFIRRRKKEIRQQFAYSPERQTEEIVKIYERFVGGNNNDDATK